MKVIKFMFSTLFTFLLFVSFSTLHAQTGSVEGEIFDRANGEPIPGASVILLKTKYGTVSNQDGSFRIDNVPAGNYLLRITFVGFERYESHIEVEPGKATELTASLNESVFTMSGILVSSLRPDLQAESVIGEQDIRESTPKDSGELLRIATGVDAVRRGPVGFDPVVRGLRETEVGTYLDGTRIFPAGPARMDSPLSHLDPSNIESIEIVKGPYALTWGTGNLSAIRVKTRNLDNIKDGVIGGRLGYGYQTNMNAFETTASVSGREGPLAVWINGAWREGNNYDSGNGVSVPADFQSREIRGKFGYRVNRSSQVIVGLGYQDQDDLDYPGRLLDAESFEAFNSSVTLKSDFTSGTIRSYEVQAYFNRVDHQMNNDQKPTAVDVPGRMPPFALDVGVDSEISIFGGSASFDVVPSDFWIVKIGADIYSANRDAIRLVQRRSNGMLIFEDQMWPDATITTGGIYTKADHSFNNRLSATGTVRLDFVDADADRATDFFLNNVSDDISQTEANFNAALSVSSILNQNWTLSAGVGTAVRTADVSERYSDRIPASKAQTSAEFVGNPSLSPERNNQADLWIEAGYPNLTFQANLFVRRIENFITLRPTDLPKRLPLSPNTVFQYQNGEADFWGFESTVAYRFVPQLTLKTSLDYLWGDDNTVDEPVLGISPLGVDVGLRYESQIHPLFAETSLRINDEQTRISASRGERPTGGYEILDIKAGFEPFTGFMVRAGVNNLFDTQYVNHLNANNPFAGIPIANFTGTRVPEPGRVFTFGVEYSF